MSNDVGAKLMAPMPSGFLAVVAQMYWISDETPNQEILSAANEQLEHLRHNGIVTTKKLGSIFVYTPGVPEPVHRLTNLRRKPAVLQIVRNANLDVTQCGIWIVRPRVSQ